MEPDDLSMSHTEYDLSINYVLYKLCAFSKFILLGFILPICKMGIRVFHTGLSLN